MPDDDDLRDLVLAEFALDYVWAARGDPDEFTRRLRVIPRWVIRMRPEIWTELGPFMMRVVVDAARDGDRVATEFLIEFLERNPHLYGFITRN